MKIAVQTTEMQSLKTLTQKSPDDLFICSATFEERCLSSVSKMEDDFITRYSVIFLFEEPLYQKERDDNLQKLQNSLTKRTTERLFVIQCQRQNPMDGISQFKDIVDQYGMVSPGSSAITLDISGLTKIYILELLYYLVSELKASFPRVIHTTQNYSPKKLTKGVEKIVTLPHFFGDPSTNKQSLHVIFLGFEPERALAVWEYYDPVRTIALQANPPRTRFRKYLSYVQKHNSYLLSRPGVKLMDVPPDTPEEVRNVLELIWSETHDSFNMTIAPLGTKLQTVGVFLFWMEHPEVRVIYSFPIGYTKSYLLRKPGPIWEVKVI